MGMLGLETALSRRPARDGRHRAARLGRRRRPDVGAAGADRAARPTTAHRSRPARRPTSRWSTRQPRASIDPTESASLSRNTPYRGLELPGPGRRHVPARPADGARREAAVTATAHPAGAVLVLEDGRTFRGEAYGAVGRDVGEAVFSTGMTGYQETLTDPSYHRQVVVMTAPHVGNTGVNDEDPESAASGSPGYVVRDPARRPSNWRSHAQPRRRARRAGRRRDQRHRHPRADPPPARARGDAGRASRPTAPTPTPLLARVRQAPQMAGAALADEVSTAEPYVVPAVGDEAVHGRGARPRHQGDDAAADGRARHRGARAAGHGHARRRARDRARRGVLLQRPGRPGDGRRTRSTLLRGVLERGIPYFGICFGNQLFGRALGFGTYKLKYGHRGINQPVMDRTTGKVEVTAHNHGFAVDAPLDRADRDAVRQRRGEPRLPQRRRRRGARAGRRRRAAAAFSVQYHPEAAAGPHDAGYLFDRFVDLMSVDRARPTPGSGR